jgi:glycosyltransferase involved in cell wall biosynthesis
MRILFIADAGSIHTRRWAEYFRDKGVDVHIASFRLYEIHGVTVHVLPTFGLGKLGYFFALRILPKLYASLRPDIVHAHYVTSYGFLAALSGFHPLIVTAWGSDVLISPKESRLMRYFARYALKHADVVTTLADHMNASVVELGIPPDKITATPFGVDTQLFAPAPPDASPHIPLKLICTRNFEPVYDVDTLIRAVAKVISGGRQLDVDLVGDGPLRQSLVDLVQALGIESHVRFHGFVEHNTLPGLLAGADIFVTPALSDGNNVSLNEAMACGCFPIATNIPANAQWIDDGRNGYLYPSGNVDLLAQSIENACANGSLRQTAKAENRSIAETRADWRACVKRMEMIYERVSGKCFSQAGR